jgi:hypothetical protein
VATRDKEDQGNAVDAKGTEGDAERGEASQPRNAESPPKAKPGVWAKYRSEIRIAVFGSIATVLVASVFAPVRAWTGGALDEVHDFFLGYHGQRLDTMKEAIEDRPFWQQGPAFEDGAFDYIEDYDRNEAVVSSLELGGTRPVAITVDELVNEAPAYEGRPVIVVGRYFEESPIETSDLFPLMSKEVVLTGNDRYAYVGTGSYSYPWRGLVAYVGILTATGRAFHEDYQEGVPTAYFIGIDGIEVGPNNPSLRGPLRELAPDEFR